MGSWCIDKVQKGLISGDTFETSSICSFLASKQCEEMKWFRPASIKTIWPSLRRDYILFHTFLNEKVKFVFTSGRHKVNGIC